MWGCCCCTAPKSQRVGPRGASLSRTVMGSGQPSTASSLVQEGFLPRPSHQVLCVLHTLAGTPCAARGAAAGVHQPWHSTRQDLSKPHLNVTVGCSRCILHTPCITRNEMLPVHVIFEEKVAWSGFARGKWVQRQLAML